MKSDNKWPWFLDCVERMATSEDPHKRRRAYSKMHATVAFVRNRDEEVSEKINLNQIENL